MVVVGTELTLPPARMNRDALVTRIKFTHVLTVYHDILCSIFLYKFLLIRWFTKERKFLREQVSVNLKNRSIKTGKIEMVCGRRSIWK